MGKNNFALLLLMGSAANLFGAASSSSGPLDTTKLKLLARQHCGFVVDLVENLRKDPRTNSVRFKSLAICGSARNGKKSLAREIADLSGRTRDEHRVKSIKGFEEFVELQTNKENPHVTILKNMHVFQEASAMEEYMDAFGDNEQVFLIGVGDQTLKRNNVLQLFDYEIELNDPDALTRRQILEFCFVQNKVEDVLLGHIVSNTERLSSGKLSWLSNELIRHAENGITRELFDEVITHVARVSVEPTLSWGECLSGKEGQMLRLVTMGGRVYLRYNQIGKFDLEVFLMLIDVVLSGLSVVAQ